MNQVWVDIHVTRYIWIYIGRQYTASTRQNCAPESTAIRTSGRASCKVPVNHQGFPPCEVSAILPGDRWCLDVEIPPCI